MTGKKTLMVLLQATGASDSASREHERLAHLYARAYGPDCTLAVEHRNAARRLHKQAERMRNEWLDAHAL